MYVSRPIAGARPLRRLSALIAVVLAAALAGPILSTARAAPLAGCESTIPRTCYVLDPTVDAPYLSVYPQVRFRAGQHILIQAGGCVQTGGHGLTWKSYVDSAGLNSSYHGLIYIPGLTPGPVRLSTVVNRNVTIPQDTYLFLGYEDDVFRDNGYYSHDDGTDDQCKNVQDAYVFLTITRNF